MVMAYMTWLRKEPQCNEDCLHPGTRNRWFSGENLVLQLFNCFPPLLQTSTQNTGTQKKKEGNELWLLFLISSRTTNWHSAKCLTLGYTVCQRVDKTTAELYSFFQEDQLSSVAGNSHSKINTSISLGRTKWTACPFVKSVIFGVRRAGLTLLCYLLCIWLEAKWQISQTLALFSVEWEYRLTALSWWDWDQNFRLFAQTLSIEYHQ